MGKFNGEKNDLNQFNRQNNGHCKSCNSDFVYQPESIWFDERGYGYSTRLTKCPYCGKIVILGHKEDKHLDINKDKKWY